MRRYGQTRNILHCDQSNVLLAHYFQFSAKSLKFCRRIWLTSFNNTALKTFARRKYLGYMSDTSRVIPILTQISLPYQPGSVADEFDWHRSIARPRKPPARCKNLGDISHTSRVIANFSSNFVAMATRVGCGRIWLTSLNSPTPKKTPGRCKNLGHISHISRVIPILTQISLPWQRGSVVVEFGWHH